MNVLIIHMRFHPDLTGTGPLVTQLAEDLVRTGHAVTVVTSLPHYGRTDIHPEHQGTRGLIRESDYHGIKVWRTRVYVPPSAAVFHRALNYLSFTFLSVLAGWQAPRPDIVLAINPPITTALSAWLVATWHRVPWVLGIQDVWPDCVVQVGQLRNPILIRLSECFERLQYRLAKKVIVLSAGMRQNLLRKGVPGEKVAVIGNWADADAVRPVSTGRGFREEHALDDRFVVLFAGNHGYVSALESVVAAAGLLADRPEILFLFVGEGNAKSGLVARATQEGLANVRFLSTQPDEVLPEMLAAANLGLVTLRKTLGELNVPSKTYTLMAAARPILAAVPGDSEIAGLVDRARCGIRVPPEDPEALAQAILKASAEREALAELGLNGRQYLEAHISRQGQTALYAEVLGEVALRGASRR